MKKFKFKLLSLIVAAVLVLLPGIPTLAATTSYTQKDVEIRGAKVNAYYFCSGDDVHVRTAPNTDSTILGIMSSGDSIYIDTAHNYVVNGFHRVWYKGHIAYIFEDYVALSE